MTKRSDIISTKKQALDEITRFAIEDPLIRELLSRNGAKHAVHPERLWESRFIEFSPILLASSRRALYSLEDNEVNALAKEFLATFEHDPFERQPRIYLQICRYLE